jgi:hypothetical protein
MILLNPPIGQAVMLPAGSSIELYLPATVCVMAGCRGVSRCWSDQKKRQSYTLHERVKLNMKDLTCIAE